MLWVSRKTTQHSMVALWQNMKQEVSLCPAWHNETVLMWKACRSDCKSDEALVAYTIEVHKKCGS